jgi:hypothetical protein
LTGSAIPDRTQPDPSVSVPSAQLAPTSGTPGSRIRAYPYAQWTACRRRRHGATTASQAPCGGSGQVPSSTTTSGRRRSRRVPMLYGTARELHLPTAAVESWEPDRFLNDEHRVFALATMPFPCRATPAGDTNLRMPAHPPMCGPTGSLLTLRIRPGPFIDRSRVLGHGAAGPSRPRCTEARRNAERPQRWTQPGGRRS